jgi:hypothetical protein
VTRETDKGKRKWEKELRKEDKEDEDDEGEKEEVRHRRKE